MGNGAITNKKVSIRENDVRVLASRQYSWPCAYAATPRMAITTADATQGIYPQMSLVVASQPVVLVLKNTLNPMDTKITPSARPRPMPVSCFAMLCTRSIPVRTYCACPARNPSTVASSCFANIIKLVHHYTRYIVIWLFNIFFKKD